MKPTEIMIGDRLAYKGQHAAFDFRVEQVTKHKIGYHAEPGESRMHYLRLNECNPIPLTSEILERNKIRYQYGKPWYQGGADGVFEFRYTSDDCSIEVKKPVRYVHQLQQAFRLCGIDKEITL